MISSNSLSIMIALIIATDNRAAALAAHPQKPELNTQPSLIHAVLSSVAPFRETHSSNRLRGGNLLPSMTPEPPRMTPPEPPTLGPLTRPPLGVRAAPTKGRPVPHQQ
eukprot:2879698-Amphidinium_carterae.1